MAAKSGVRWTQVQKHLENLDKPELIEALKDLFDHSADNRTFLAYRFLDQGDGGEALEKCRKRIVDQFFPKRGFGKLNLKDARSAIREYRKATSDLAGTLELMMTYVEQGTEFTNSYGDIEESFYNSMESVLGELCDILRSAEGQPFYPRFQERLLVLVDQTSGIGWGYGDGVDEIVMNLVGETEDDEEREDAANGES